MSSGSSSCHILVAGGCHVNGYPIGEASSFSALTASALGYTYTCIAPIGLGNPSRLFDQLQQHRAPDIAVLQFGNYEVPRPIARHARTVLSRTLLLNADKSSVSSSKRPWLSLPPDHVFRPTSGWHSRAALKRTYATAAQYLNPPLYDAAAVRERLRWLLSHIAPFKVPVTVVLTPLPCADPMARNFRIAAAPIFHEESARAGILSLDTAAALGYAPRNRKRSFAIYADERHLNLRGHQLLASALTQLLDSQIPSSARAAAELESAFV